MSSHSPEQDSERILLVSCGGATDPSNNDLAGVLEPGLGGKTEVVCVDSLDDCIRLLCKDHFDLVVVDFDSPQLRSAEFLAQLRLQDYEPEVLIVSRCDSPEVIKEIAASRKRYVLRDEHWLETTLLAARDLLRIRRLESEMNTIRAQLTESNALLQEKNKRLDDFCTTIAHDIRGPLAGLMLKVEYILDAYDGELDERCVGLMKRALSSCQRLVEMVQEMYEFAKLGAKASVVFEVNLSELVKEVVYDLSYDDSLDVEIGIGELPKVWGNSGLLRRVFSNLISNAAKYNDKPEKLINIGLLDYDHRPIGMFARIYVDDNGPGIPKAQIRDIFSMFKRGSDQDKDGLGVGLAVVHRIVELHQGKIEVESEIGIGTRFIVSLPMERM